MNSQEEKIKRIKKALQQFWQNYEIKIILTISFIIISILAFEAGILKGQKWQQKPLVIEKPAENCEIIQNSAQTQNLTSEEQNTVSTVNHTTKNIDSQTQTGINCTFVGSRNSNKYHLPTCRWAKQIKPENLVCFSSVEEAIAKGYQPDKNCIK